MRKVYEEDILSEEDLMDMEGETVLVIDENMNEFVCSVKILGKNQVHCINEEKDFYYMDGEKPEGGFWVLQYNN